MSISVLFLIFASWGEAIGCEATLAEVGGAVKDAERALAAQQLDAFAEGQAVAAERLHCLTDPLTPGAAAAWHRFMAYHYMEQQQPDLVLSSFHAALMLEPFAVLPEQLAPADSITAMMYMSAAVAEESERVPMQAPDGFTLWVDGAPAADRPTSMTAVLQILDGSGNAVGTQFLLPGDTPPEWASGVAPELPAVAVVEPEPVLEPDPVAEPEPAPLPPPPSTSSSNGPSVPLLAAAGGAAVGSGLLFAMSAGARSKLLDPATPLAEIEDLGRRSNGLGYASQATLGAALSLATIGVVVQF